MLGPVWLSDQVTVPLQPEADSVLEMIGVQKSPPPDTVGAAGIGFTVIWIPEELGETQPLKSQLAKYVPELLVVVPGPCVLLLQFKIPVHEFGDGCSCNIKEPPSQKVVGPKAWIEGAEGVV